MWRAVGERLRGIEIDWYEYALVAGLGVFVVLRVIYALPRFSDGNIYLYLSYLISQGLVPYRDFFYSSPPLLPYLLSGYGVVFGFTWQAFALAPLLLSAVDTVLIYVIAGRLFSRLAGLVGALAYLFSFAVLATTDFASDVHVVLTLLLLGVLAMQYKKYWLAGVLLGLAVLAKVYAAVVVAGLVGHLVWHREWQGVAWLIGVFAAVIVGVSALFWLLVGGAFYDMVVVSHLGSIDGLSKAAIFKFFVRHDWLLLAGPLLWLYLRRRVPSLIVVPVVVLLVFYVGFQDIYYLYGKMMVAWLTLWLAWGVYVLRREVAPRVVMVASLVVVVVVGGVAVWRYVGEQAETAVIGPLNEIVEYVVATTEPGEMIYGSFEVTPLVALGAERGIWNNYADTNIKFFQTGYFSMEERVSDVRQNRVPVIITKGLMTPGGSLLGGQETVLPGAFFADYCEVGRTFAVERDYSHNAVVVWHCNLEGR